MTHLMPFFDLPMVQTLLGFETAAYKQVARQCLRETGSDRHARCSKPSATLAALLPSSLAA